jgi:hypothetical protein
MIFDWITSPEAQADPHYWLATAAGHVLIGAVLWGMAAWALWRVTGATRRLLAASVVALAYAAVEGAEWPYWAGSTTDGLQDAALDFAFVEAGAALAWATWAHRLAAVTVTVAGLAALAAVFVPRKGKPDA